MKRPAPDPPEIEPFRTRRRFASPQPAAILNSGGQPHPGLVSDDEQAESPTQVLPNVNTSIPQPSLNQSSNDVANVVKYNEPPKSGIVIEIVPNDDATVGTSTRRPLRRLKLIPPREPSPSDFVVETDSNLNTPIMTPAGLRAPPCSPSQDYESDGGRHSRRKTLSEIPRESEELGMELEVVKRSLSPIAASELFEPDHRPPTPPYYVQHFNEPGFNGYEGDSKSLAGAGRNASTYVRKATFPRPSKRQKNKGAWSFKNCEEYPRGETPTLEMILGKEDDLDADVAPKKEETETESEEDEEVSRDPGIPVTLTVGIDGSGRFLCKWGTCDKSFARNDHLGRHVRVSHLRVRKHRCDPCGMAFIGVKGLRNHERTHNLHTNTSETAVSGDDEDPEQDADGEMDFIYTKKSPPISYLPPTGYMFEPDGEEET